MYLCLVARRRKTQKKLAHDFVVFHKNTAIALAVGHIVHEHIYGRKFLWTETNSKIETHKLAYKINRFYY